MSLELSPSEIRTYYHSRVPKLKRQANGEERGPCVIHGGKDPNLSVNTETGLAFCHSACDKGWDVIAFEQALTGADFETALREVRSIIGRPSENGQRSTRQGQEKDLLPALRVREKLAREGFRIAVEFEFGETLRKVRFEHGSKVQKGKDKPEKTFRWERRGPDGSWYSGQGEQPIPLYANATFRDRDQLGQVLGFEGEGKADAVAGLGLPAFSFRELSPESAQTLTDLDVVLWPDRDKVGSQKAETAAKIIAEVARSVRIVEPPAELPEAGDVVDALAMGWPRERIDALIAEAKPFGTPKPRVLSVADILRLDVPEASMLIESLFPALGASLIVGASKSGKTLSAIQAAIAVASGEALYGNYRVLSPGPVLVIEKDDPAGAASVKTILRRSSVPVAGIPFHLVADIPYQFGTEFLAWLEGEVQRLQVRLVVLDSYTALRGPRPKGIDIVKVEQEDLSRIDAMAKRNGCAVVIIHHSSKGSAGLDWSEKAAGTFAMSAATESQMFISRFAELDAAAPERLVRVRGRHSADLEMVIRFRPDSLDFGHVLEGGGAPLYPLIQQIETEFGSRMFSPKDLSRMVGSIATAHRHITRLFKAGVVLKRGFGEYTLSPDVAR